MKVCRLLLPDGAVHLGALVNDVAVDLTAAGPAVFGSMAAFLAWSRGRCHSLVDDMAPYLRQAPAVGAWQDLAAEGVSLGPRVLNPVDRQEVWGAGVTYLRSRQAREQESGAGQLYNRVYDAPRPELFFKATPHRVAGPGEPVRVRADSRWTVPEPELALVLNSALETVGYTLANDVTARDLEGENALYLPQAKIWDGCCALGPVVTLAATVPDVTRLVVACRILRGGRALFAQEIGVGRMKRSFEELIGYLGRDNSFPDGVVLMTGTGMVPPDDVALADGDVVEIACDELGALTNPVRQGD